jgi:hypothetical protein
VTSHTISPARSSRPSGLPPPPQLGGDLRLHADAGRIGDDEVGRREPAEDVLDPAGQSSGRGPPRFRLGDGARIGFNALDPGSGLRQRGRGLADAGVEVPHQAVGRRPQRRDGIGAAKLALDGGV